MNDDIHSCSYYCQRPACIKAQRDELVRKYVEAQPAERGDALKKVEPVDRQHCQCPSCVDGIIHDAGCAVHNEPAMKIGPCDCSKRKSIDAAIFVGNPEPRAWISTVMCRGPDYGKERYDRLPIQSLNPLYYKHTPLYTAPPPAAGLPDGWKIVEEVAEEMGRDGGTLHDKWMHRLSDALASRHAPPKD